MTLPFEPAAHLADRFLRERIVTRIWERDPSVWRAEPGSEAARSIANRLGWLDVGTTMPPHLDRIAALADSVRAESIQAVYLLGMGGSSLCAEVIRVGARNFPRLSAADRARHHRRADLERGGGTPRPGTELFPRGQQERRHRGSRVDGAILLGTDDERLSVMPPDDISSPSPTTGRHCSRSQPRARLPRHLPQSVGHRRSVLGALTVRIDPGGDRRRPPRRRLLSSRNHDGGRMPGGESRKCGSGARRVHRRRRAAGRDKLTVFLPPSLHTLGLWIEQLVAESTGKNGKGVLPVVDEPLGRPEDYGQDRAFVVFASDRDAT